jgi:hypothetical protein
MIIIKLAAAFRGRQNSQGGRILSGRLVAFLKLAPILLCDAIFFE